MTLVPVLALAYGIERAASHGVGWSDVAAFGVTYVLCGLGITVGFHRLLTHRAFKTRPAVRGALACLGSAAVEGPVIEWVANHRKHHAFSDKDGDPHSPHVGTGAGGAVPCGVCGMRIWAGCSGRVWRIRSVMRPTCSPTG